MLNMSENFASHFFTFELLEAIPKSVKIGAAIVGDLLGPGLIDTANLM